MKKSLLVFILVLFGAIISDFLRKQLREGEAI